MSLELQHPAVAPQRLSHQFEQIDQQNEIYIVGMWTFLVTEIMFFGALFVALTVYRSVYPDAFEQAHSALNVWLGLTNTFILLTSSFTAAMAVRSKMLGQRVLTLLFLGITIVCAFGFLGVKYVEYSAEFREHHFPGPNFQWSQTVSPSTAQGDLAANSQVALGVPKIGVNEFPANYQPQQLELHKRELFFSLYFVMTGLHGFHVIIGILVLSTLWLLIYFNHPTVDDYMPVELAGLYWHFVDIVWIFLYPLVYLIGKQ